MKFRYIAYDSQGRKVKGILEAEGESQAVYLIRRQELSPTLVKPYKEKAASIWQMEIMEPDVHDLVIGKKALFQFAEKMSIMLHAGVSLSMAMDVMVSGEKNRRHQKIYRAVQADLYAGLSLSDSIRTFRAFPKVMVNMVSAGEETGHLDWAFDKTAQLYKNQLEYREKVATAAAYPAFLLVLWAAMFVGMTVFVLPRFSDMYARFDAELPALTRFMLSVSEFIQSHGWIILILLTLSLAAFVFSLAKSASFARKMAALELRIPVLGHLSLIGNTNSFTQVMSALLQTGVEVVDALQIAAAVMTNSHFSGAVCTAADEISHGAKVYHALQKCGVFEPLFLSMIHIAEESSMLPETFSKLADLYEKESIAELRRTTAILEPVLTLVVGLAIAIMVLAVVLPMFDMYSTILG